MKRMWRRLAMPAGIVLLLLTYTRSFSADGKPAPVTREEGIKTIRTMSPFTVSIAMKSPVAIKGIAGFSKNGHPIEAYYFPGTGSGRAMVIGGVHGSELSAIEVARVLLDQLAATGDNEYSVIVIPCLFPDNAGHAISNPALIGSTNNVGRYSHNEAADPNRQMPALGTAFDNDKPVDFAGRTIETENQLLLKMIQEFKPQRIVNLHAIRVPDLAGVYADPRTTAKGEALEYASDSSLAISIAMHIEKNGGSTPGNQLRKRPTSLYYCDPPVAGAGNWQKRNLLGSKLPGNRGYGVSLGSWASTAVDDPVNGRPAIRLLTIEFPGYKRPSDYTDPYARQYCRKQVNLYAKAIREVFLQEE